MRHRIVLLAAAVGCGTGLLGCSSDGSHWRVNYRDMDVEHAYDTSPEGVHIEPAYSVTELEFAPARKGYRVLGSSRFTTAGTMDGPAGEPGTEVRDFAAGVGATLVRWSNRPIRPAQDGFEERFEYYAVFYREVGPQTRGQIFANKASSPREFERTLYASYDYERSAPEPDKSERGKTELAGAEVPIDAEP
jgi:hypothetical protein